MATGGWYELTDNQLLLKGVLFNIHRSTAITNLKLFTAQSTRTHTYHQGIIDEGRVNLQVEYPVVSSQE